MNTSDFLPRAIEGDMDAQYFLGMCYMKQLDVEGNAAEAVKWLQMAQRQGDIGAKRQLGICYENGVGVLSDERTAAYWYSKAAEQGEPEATFLKIKIEAERGDASALNGLGFRYSSGTGALIRYRNLALINDLPFDGELEQLKTQLFASALEAVA